MGKVIVGMTTSVDGFVNDRHGSIERLYPDLPALRKTKLLQEAMANTGAVVMGRRAYDLANGDFTGYDFQVPLRKRRRGSAREDRGLESPGRTDIKFRVIK
jgi:hypothetical protein